MRNAERAVAPEPKVFRSWFHGLPFFSAAFLLGCFFYVWLRIEPAFEYQHMGPEFFLRRSFLDRFLARPGGLAEFVAAFLAQLNFYSWLGALVFTVLCGGIILLVRGLLRQIAGARTDLMALVIPFLLLVLRARYNPQTLLLATGLAITAGFSLGVVSIPARARFLAPIGCWVSGALLFYCAGLWALAAFAVICCLDELMRLRSPVRAILCLACLATAPLWLALAPDIYRAPILNPWTKRLTLASALGAYAYLPISAVFLKLAQRVRLSAGQSSDSQQKSGHGHKVKPARVLFSWAQTVWLKAALFALGWAGTWFGLDLKTHTVAHIDYLTATGQYAQVPTVAATLSRDDLDPSSEIRLQSALYHTGRLCEDLFAFRNQSSWDVLPGLSRGIETCRAEAPVLLEMGLVSDAEHYAHEALEFEGARPEILALLARINILKQRPQAARVFLTALSQEPFQGEWPRACLRSLATGAPLPDCDELNHIRSCRATNDLPHESLPTEPLLKQLLHRNPYNRMAFEYLMAHWLIHLQMEKIVEVLPALSYLGYKEIPRHLEEAILLHERLKGTKVDLHELTIRPETRARFERFSAAMEQGLDQSEEGRRELTREFGDTFWYFYIARRHG